MQEVQDFGSVARHPALRAAERVGVAVTVVAAVAVALGALGLQWQSKRDDERAYAAAWTTVGPPCPPISRDWFARLQIEHPTPFAFQGIAGVMAHGGVSCTTIDYADGRRTAPFPVCQFSAPFAVMLKTPRGDLYVEPGVGRQVSVTLRGGDLRCLVGGNAE
jgi:hypothetical protein